MYAYGSHAKTGAGSYIRVCVYYCEPIYEPMASTSSQLSPASFLLHQSAELPKNTPFQLTKTCSCRMIPWASKRGRLTLKRRFVLQITLESISESLSFKIFLGGHTPLVYALRALPSTSYKQQCAPPFLHSWIRPCIYYSPCCSLSFWIELETSL